jgi:hypothetical protein
MLILLGAMTAKNKQRQIQLQIPFGNDNKKNKCKDIQKDKCQSQGTRIPSH